MEYLFCPAFSGTYALDVPVIRPNVAETAALGAAYAAGLAVGFWKNYNELRELGQGQRMGSNNGREHTKEVILSLEKGCHTYVRLG
ncbi:MAG TPA: hypothetical protein VF896_12560 [Anaerolineales bacterium]